ncbi:MAG: enoyl-CoA hydratase-related protein [Vicinamibacteria bacterium]
MELSTPAGALRVVLPRRLSWADIAGLRDRVGAAREGLLLLTGENGAFCEGGTLDAADTAEPRPEDFAALLRAIETAPVMVVALVDGPALGAGAGLAAAADVVIATPRARFGLPETVMGLLPAMVFPALARRLGVARARRLALGAPPLPAEEALAQGLVDEIAEDGPAAAARVARRLARQDPQAVSAFKRLVADHFGTAPAYETAAADALRARWAAPETRQRLARFAAGGAPWDGDDD